MSMIENREQQIKSASEIIAYGCSDELKAALIQDFPELAESEDERTRRELIEFLNDYRKTHDVPANKAGWIIETISWLEKQKEQKPLDIPSGGSGAQGITPPFYKLDVKPAEWSEEDEYYRNQLIVFCEKCMQQTSEAIGCANWLKSLRPQPHWKPSEEQIEALCSKLPIVKGSGDKIQDILQTLYDDLKKL